MRTMKRCKKVLQHICLIAASLPLFCITLTAQETTEVRDTEQDTKVSFTIPGQEWTIMYNMNRPGGPTDNIPPQFNTKKIGEPVTMDAKTYYPVISDGYRFGDGDNQDHNKIVYYLREEGDKVYIRLSEGAQEKLLFDYSIEEGDNFSLQMIRYDGDVIPVKLIKKDVVEMAGATRRVYFFEQADAKTRNTNESSYTDDFSWIEGLGSPWDFVSYDDKNITDAYPPQTVCFKDAMGISHPIFGGDCGKTNQAEWIDTPADNCIVTLHEGNLQVIARDNLYHSLRVYNEGGALLLDGVSFCGSYTASLPNAHTLLIVIDKAGRKVVAQ